MKLRSQREGLAIPATVVTANLPKDTLMKITGNRTIDKATAGTVHVGRLTVPVKTANAAGGTLETRFKELIEIKTTEILAAGDLVKHGVVDVTTGENTVAKWLVATDAVALAFGVVWNGAASGGVAEVLTY